MGAKLRTAVNLGHRIADCYGDDGGYVIYDVRPLAELVAKTKTRIAVDEPECASHA